MAINDKKKYFWLKLDKDFFKRHDIRIVESMPNGKDYILFYLKLLCESTSHEGYLRFSDTIPYNDEMLATITNTNIDIVRSAVKVFNQLQMIHLLDDGTFFMNEVQKMIGAETGNAKRKREYREQQKLLIGTNGGQCPQEIDIEIDIEKEKDIYKGKTARPKKTVYGNYSKVKLTDDEFNKLKEEHGELVNDIIQHLDDYKEMTGKTYKSDYLAIKKWVIDAFKQKMVINNQKTTLTTKFDL